MHNRFYCPETNITERTISITDKSRVHHIVNVLRFSQGDNLIVFDGKGSQCEAEIAKITKSVIELDIKRKEEMERNPISITLACAIPKKAKFDLIVEKCTELGADEIIPMRTDRTEVVLNNDRAKTKIDRWRQIAINASEQSQRSFIPEINEIMTYEVLVQQIKKYDLAILPALTEKKTSIIDAVKDFQGKSIIVFIGPEGDFTEKELALAKSLGAKPVTLGRRVLKVDTAAIFAVSILNHILKT